MEKEAYLYHNYISNLKGATMEVVPFVYYDRPDYKPKNVRYEFLKDAENGESDCDDFLKIRTGNFRDQVDLILDELSRRERLTYQNLQSLHSDLMDVYQAKVQLDNTHFYTQSRQWQGVWNHELDIKKQIRNELKELYKDTSRASESLRRSLLEYKMQNQKYRLFSIEDVLDRRETSDS